MKRRCRVDTSGVRAGVGVRTGCCVMEVGEGQGPLGAALSSFQTQVSPLYL